MFSKLSSSFELRPEEMLCLPSFAKLSEVLRTSDKRGKGILSVSHKSEGAEQNKETNKKPQAFLMLPDACACPRSLSGLAFVRKTTYTG